MRVEFSKSPTHITRALTSQASAGQPSFTAFELERPRWRPRSAHRKATNRCILTLRLPD